MITPEKNDVEIGKLFQWGKETQVFDTDDKVILTCYQRLVGDADLNRARVFALRKSAELRKKLRNPDSDERFAYVADADLLTEEALTNYLLVMKSKQYSKDAYENVRLPFPKEPDSEASLEDQEAYQAQIDSYPERLEAELRKYIERKLEVDRKLLENEGKDAMYKIYQENVVNDLCEMEMYNKYTEMCTYFGTYTDPEYKDKMFVDFNEFDDLPSEVKEQLKKGYSSIELSMDFLKR